MAEKLGIRAVDLPEVVGLSKAMLFAYRKGKYPISWRAWRKLEAAERAAGLVVLPESVLEMDRIEMKRLTGEGITPEEEAAVKQGGADFRKLMDELSDLRSEMNARLDRIEKKLSGK